MFGEGDDLLVEAGDAHPLQPEGLDDAHAVDAFAEVLVDAVIGLAHAPVQGDQAVGLPHEDRQAGDRQHKGTDAQKGVVPEQHADGRDHHQAVSKTWRQTLISASRTLSASRVVRVTSSPEPCWM